MSRLRTKQRRARCRRRVDERYRAAGEGQPFLSGLTALHNAFTTDLLAGYGWVPDPCRDGYIRVEERERLAREAREVGAYAGVARTVWRFWEPGLLPSQGEVLTERLMHDAFDRLCREYTDWQGRNRKGPVPPS